MTRLAKKELPQFIKAVEKTRTERNGRIMMLLDSFSKKEASLLWEALQYASERNVVIEFAPSSTYYQSHARK